jgi:hypothetical protein
VEVLPVAVVDIAGEENEVDGLRERPVDQSFQGRACRGAQAFERSAMVAVETAQGTVDVEIGGVQEAASRTRVNRVRLIGTSVLYRKTGRSYQHGV